MGFAVVLLWIGCFSKLVPVIFGTNITINTTVSTSNITTSSNFSQAPTTTQATEATTLPPTTRAWTRDGTCEQYQGVLCKDLLNKTREGQEEQLPRFIDSRLGFNRTEWIIMQFMKAVDRIDDEQSYCKGLLRGILCQYTLPPCDVYNAPRNYCREDCDEIFDRCDRALGELLGAAKSITEFLGVNFIHIGIPNCTALKYSHEMDNANTSCIHLGLFDFNKKTKPKEPPPSPPIGLFVGIICGVLVLAALVTFVAVKKRRARQKGLGFHGMTFTAVTMRDRLRAETMRALDEDKLMSLYNPEDLNQFPLDRIEYMKDLGEGNFGQVFQGRAFGLRPGDKPDTELIVAVKTLKQGCSNEMKTSFLQEVTLMAVLHHPNIVELLAVSTEEEPYGMIFEFMSQGDLNQYMRKQGPYSLEEGGEDKEDKEKSLTQEDLLSISLQVSSGMEHLQSMRFVHRDLATRNCLVGDGLVVKIADFGMSRDVYASDYYKVEGQAVMPIRWMPPEALLYGRFTVESDVYSFGVLLWEVYAFALQPYYGYTNEEVCGFIKKGVHLGKPEDCPDHIYDVMKSCWNKDPSQRPNFQMIISQIKNEETTEPESPTTMATTDSHPLYMNTEIAAAESEKGQRAAQPAPVLLSQSGYMNVGIGTGDDRTCPGHVNPTFEEGEQAV